VEIEAVRPRVTPAGRRCLDRLGRLTETTDARASMAPQRHDPLHRRRRQSGQHRRLGRPRVLPAAIVAIPEPPPIEQAPDPRLHRGQHLRHIQIGEARRRVKRHGARRVPREHAVHHERMEMHVEVERAPEALNDGDRAAALGTPA
jgi:hypothetical protein